MKQAHWENVYTTKSSEQVSWYQPHVQRSYDWIVRTDMARDGQIIDVGGGASTLVDDLLEAGYQNITVLDLSGAALQVAQQRLGALRAARVQWREADITATEFSAHMFDIWHDRAVFHFLTEAADRRAYVAQLRHAVKRGGHIIMATFSLDGPTRCSGLPIVQYSAASLQAELGAQFELVEQANEQHTTPSGAAQNFIYCHFIRRD